MKTRRLVVRQIYVMLIVIIIAFCLSTCESPTTSDTEGILRVVNESTRSCTVYRSYSSTWFSVASGDTKDKDVAEGGLSIRIANGISEQYYNLTIVAGKVHKITWYFD